MSVEEDLEAVAERWGYEILQAYQSCYCNKYTWSDFLDLTIVAILSELAELKKVRWEK